LATFVEFGRGNGKTKKGVRIRAGSQSTRWEGSIPDEVITLNNGGWGQGWTGRGQWGIRKDPWIG